MFATEKKFLRAVANQKASVSVYLSSSFIFLYFICFFYTELVFTFHFFCLHYSNTIIKLPSEKRMLQQLLGHSGSSNIQFLIHPPFPNIFSEFALGTLSLTVQYLYD